MKNLFVEAQGHWGGNDPEYRCGRLLIEAKTDTQARALAALARLFAEPTQERLDRLADAADGIAAQLADAADLVGC